MGMIKDTPENRKLLIKLGHLKKDKNDTSKKKSTKQNSGNTKRTEKQSDSE